MGVIQKVGVILVKNAPKICVAIGVAGVGVGVVVACKDTLAGEKDITAAKEAFNDKAYMPAVKRFAKVYWPSVVIIGGSLFVMVSGHYILAKRYAGLVVAYESLNKSYRSYRGYITETQGKDVDFAARHHEDKIYLADDDSVVVTDNEIFIPDRDLSDFAVFWGPGYSLNLGMKDYPNNEIKEMARDIEAQANEMLKERGYLFLYEVYNMLGLIDVEAPPDGIGWCYGIGDNYVDFGIFDVRNADVVMNKNEPILLLDFNHDGYILPYI